MRLNLAVCVHNDGVHLYSLNVAESSKSCFRQSELAGYVVNMHKGHYL